MSGPGGRGRRISPASAPVRRHAVAGVVIGGVLALLGACGGTPAPDAVAWPAEGSLDSPIAGETLRCAADYPDSRLVFNADGTVGGRFGGRDVDGRWHAPAPDRVRVVIRAGGVMVRDTIRRTAGGWQGETTRCG